MIPLGEPLDRPGRSEAGWVSINPLVLFPMLLLILLGATDFARMYYTSATLIRSAEAGAQYGSRTVISSADAGGMASAALRDAALSGMTATASQSCSCGGISQACGSVCAGTKHVLVAVNTSYTFHPWFPYFGVPSTVAMTRTAVKRAPNR
jgi:Flp pilus assembly protein TadG